MLLITIDVLRRARADVTVSSVENQPCTDAAHPVNILVMLWFFITLRSHRSTHTSLFRLGTWGLGWRAGLAKGVGWSRVCGGMCRRRGSGGGVRHGV